jgi:CHAT domain-containing protein/tetratricopeptide (TPR) repeat protein
MMKPSASSCARTNMWRLINCFAALVFAPALMIGLLLAPASAQQDDLNALFKRANELLSAGQYDAALVEAQKFEAAAKARLGTSDANYANALSTLAKVYQFQGKYADAEGLYKRALAIWEAKLGKDHPNVTATLNNLGTTYQLQGKYADAARLFQRALAIWEAKLGKDHPLVADALINLGSVYDSQGKYADAEELFRRALAIEELKFGKDHPNFANALSTLGGVYESQGKYADAEEFFRRALAIYEAKLGKDHPLVAGTLESLAQNYVLQGKYGLSEGLLQRALAIEEAKFGKDHPNVAGSLINLANLYRRQGKYVDTAGLYKRALAIYEATHHPLVSVPLLNLAALYKEQAKYADAEELFRRALAIAEAKFGKDHPNVATTLNALASIYREQGKYADAEGLYKRALAIEEAKFGKDHPNVADSLLQSASVYQAQGKYADAEGLLRRALAIWEAKLGKDHPNVARALNILANLKRVSGDAAAALALSRKASVVIEASAALPSGRADEFFRYRNSGAPLYLYVANLALAADAGVEPAEVLGREAFEVAQWVLQSSAGVAVQQMAARFASGSDARATRVREHQDLTLAWRERTKALVNALSKPQSQGYDTLTNSIRKQMADIASKLNAAAARLEKEFPDYAAFASPKPVKLEEAENLLRPDEALLFFLIGASGNPGDHGLGENEGSSRPGNPGDHGFGEIKTTYVFALTHEGFDWKSIPLGGDALAEKVAAFRRGLDVNQLNAAITASRKPELFNLGLANELYTTLFGPVEGLVRNKKQLIVVPTGALTALPFHLLVTEKPPAALPEDLSGYRDAAWLIKRQAVSVLPSVASLKALRAFGHKDEAPKPMVGFGDPVFSPDVVATTITNPATMTAARSLTTSSYTDFWQGIGIDRAKLARALPPLPDTALELRAVAQKLGAPMSDIHLGRDASETTVKRLPLANYRIVYFATHGLVAGDIKGLGEPALALSIPAQPSALDDGLLTASEVAQLKLNADWVVLSACNTIAGDKPGAEALSGLARAFFYAGARALLVSHWAVASNAATRLTTSTFDILKADPSLGRAEALRHAMLAYMNDKAEPLNAYPAFWAPFEIVGEGTEARNDLEETAWRQIAGDPTIDRLTDFISAFPAGRHIAEAQDALEQKRLQQKMADAVPPPAEASSKATGAITAPADPAGTVTGSISVRTEQTLGATNLFGVPVPLPRPRPRFLATADTDVPLPRPRPKSFGPAPPQTTTNLFGSLKNLFQLHQ